MTALISYNDYKVALAAPDRGFSDPEIQKRRCKFDSKGLPEGGSGQFAQLCKFELLDGTQPIAVRLFTKFVHEVSETLERYAEITKFLARLNSDYFANFQLSAPDSLNPRKGVLAQGRFWPVIRMDWIEPPTLGTAIETHYTDSHYIAAIRAELRRYSALTETAGFSHGDIHPDNVMVPRAGKIKFVDYDGIYVPAFNGLKARFVGQPDYQSPARMDNPLLFGPWLDRFPLLVLDLTLAALQRSPDLLLRRTSAVGEGILLGATDFAAPDSSAMLDAIERLPGLAHSVGVFRSSCKTELWRVPTLTEFVALEGGGGFRSQARAAASSSFAQSPASPQPTANGSAPSSPPLPSASGPTTTAAPPSVPLWASTMPTWGSAPAMPVMPSQVSRGPSARAGATRRSWPFLSFVVVLICGLVGLGIYGSKSFSPPTTPAAVSDSSKVQGQDVKVGAGTTARPGDKVSVLYVGYVGKISSSTIFDSSAAHGDKPLTFVLGSKGLISGFQIGVNGMKVGGERLISIPPLRAYGPRVVTDSSGKVVIPADSTLIFDIKLVGVTGAGNGVQNAQDEPAISSREKESEHTAGDEEATNEIGDAISKLGRQGLQFLRAQGHEWEQAAKERQEQEADRQRQQEERLREQQAEQRRAVAAERQRQMEERRQREVERERQRQIEEKRQVQRREAQKQLAVQQQEQYLESVRCHAFLNGDQACCPVGQKPDQVYVGYAHHPFQTVCKKVPGWEGPHPGLLTGGTTNFNITTSSPVTPGHPADIGNGVTISVTPPVTPGHPAYLGNGASVSISPGLQ